jgi:hypothetical protein
MVTGILDSSSVVVVGVAAGGGEVEPALRDAGTATFPVVG